MKDKMKDMREMMDEKVGDRMKKDFDLKDMAGYFKNMTKEQRQMFDEKLNERNGRMKDGFEGMMDKFSQGKKAAGTMTDEQKKKFNDNGKEMMKMKMGRDNTFDDHDFKQRIKSGYFDKMSGTER